MWAHILFKRLPALLTTAVLLFSLSLVLPLESSAKDDENRIRFYGWIEEMPENLQGIWIIGGRQVTTNPTTEFDQEEGLLQIGGCAKVDIRNGRLHEIDSEPLSDCR